MTEEEIIQVSLSPPSHSSSPIILFPFPLDAPPPPSSDLHTFHLPAVPQLTPTLQEPRPPLRPDAQVAHPTLQRHHGREPQRGARLGRRGRQEPAVPLLAPLPLERWSRGSIGAGVFQTSDGEMPELLVVEDGKVAGLSVDHRMQGASMIYDTEEQSVTTTIAKADKYNKSLNPSNTIAEQYARNIKASAPPPFPPRRYTAV